MLTSGQRPQMLARAVRCFQSQRYRNKKLAILHSGPDPFTLDRYNVCGPEVFVTWLTSESRRRPIGELRNLGNALSVPGALDCQIIAHFDDDDWSAPDRLSEQVAFLKASGKQAVGYHQMLFWVDRKPRPEAWLYSSPNPAYCLGTSLLYWRKTWEKVPFEHVSIAEDLLWQNKVKTAAQSSLRSVSTTGPRMIATIHGANTCAQVEEGKAEWSRCQLLELACIEALLL